MKAETKTKQFRIRLTETEYKKISLLAKDYKTSMSGLFLLGIAVLEQQRK